MDGREKYSILKGGCKDMWVMAGWGLIGAGGFCFAVGVRSLWEVEVLRVQAGDIELWGLRRPLAWLRRAGFGAKLIGFVRKRKGRFISNLRYEATHTGIEATSWFASSAFFVTLGGIMLFLGV